MKRNIQKALSGLFSPKEISFIFWFFIIFLSSAGLLAVTGLLPSELVVTNTGSERSNMDTNAQGTPNTQSNSALGILRDTSKSNTSSSTSSNSNGPKSLVQVGIPTRLAIPALQVDAQIIRPNSTSVSILDNALTEGPVYYPGSGTINSGNIFIFGHSTNRSVVINPAYKVFNNLQNLKEGDSIFVESEGKTFLYKVKTVSKVDKNEALVKFDTTRHLLTISTCDSFGAKSDRYVVTAEFVSQI